MKQPSAAPKYKSISLFSGIGGLDIGLEKAGFSPIFCCEIDPNAAKTIQNHLDKNGHSTELHGDINDIDPNDLLQRLRLKPGEIDLLAGGPPCQSFSLIGKRQCLNDARGALLYKMADYAEALQPKVVLIEQVKGLISAPCENNKKGGALEKLVSRLENMGYLVTYKILMAADYGIPQLRERLFIVATKDKKFNFPLPTAAHKYKTVRDALAGLPNPKKVGEPEVFPNHADITPARDRERICGVPEGECLAKQHHLPKSQRMNLTNKDTTKFRRLAWNAPALTLRGGEAFYHPQQDRYLTPREYLRLHGFDDDFILFGPIRGRSGSVRILDQHRLVANAVPPKLAEIIGKEIAAQMLSGKTKKKTVSKDVSNRKEVCEACTSKATA